MTCALSPMAGRTTAPAGALSRATVTRARKNSHWLAASFTAMRSLIGLVHWKRVDGSNQLHCLQQCSAAWHLGQLPLNSMSAGSAVAQL